MWVQCVYLALATLVTAVFATHFVLEPNGHFEELKSPGYPAHAAPLIQQKWKLSTESGSRIRVNCSDIRLHKKSDKNCHPDEYLRITDGKIVKNVCGTLNNFSMLSTGNKLTVKLRKGKYGGGGILCTVQGRMMAWYGEMTTKAYQEISSESIDSSEHGGPPGRKNTTCPCGWANKLSKRVVNGVESRVNEFPFIAAICTREGAHFCGGSILTKYHVLTAAHCTWTFVKNNVSLVVYLGEHNLAKLDETKATQKINVKQIIQHPQFNSTYLQNDIALLVLEKKIDFNKFVGPVCLPLKGWFDLTYQYVRIIGWGLLKTGGSSSTTLQKVDLRVIDMESCHRVYPFVSLKQKIQICTFGHNRSPCKGDSGGPVLWLDPETNRYTLVGLVSFARVCADSNPTVHAAVASYIDWIKRHIKVTKPKSTCSKRE